MTSRRRLLTALVVLMICVPAAARGGGPPRAKPVRAVALETRKVGTGRTFVGTVEPSRRSRVSVETDGFVLKRPVRIGQRVKETAIVAELKSDLIDKQLDVADARVRQAQRAVDVLKNGFRDEDKREAASAVERAKATLKLANWKEETAQRLYDDGRKVTEEELRNAKVAVLVADRLLEAARARNDKLQAGQRPDEIAEAKARVAVEKAEVARLTFLKTQYVARAPFTGYVVAERTEAGEWIRRGDPVVELVDLDHVDVVVPVLEDFIRGVRVDQPQTVVVPSLGDRLFEGTVHSIVPEAAARTRTLPVRIRVENVIQDGRPLLKAGMYARVILPVGEERQALMAPKDALKLGGPRPEVFVVDPESKKALPIAVTLGVVDGGWIEVRGPLKAGQLVVTKGNERLFPGDVVTVQED